VSRTVVKLLDHQWLFVFSDAPFPAIVGGLGSGKTQGGTNRIIRLMQDDHQCNFLYMMPTYDLLRLRAIPGVEEDLTLQGYSFTTNKSASEISVKGHGKIIFRSYDNPARIVAFEVGHAIVDEIDTIDKEKASFVWRKITERVRQTTKQPNSIGVVTTPDQGVSGFVYDRWVKNPKPGYEIIKASTYDNPFLPADYAQNILNNYDPILADLYLRGEFVSLNQNKVYWAFDSMRHHTDRTLKPTDKIFYYGQDFNVGGNVTVIFVIDKGIPHAVLELTAMNTPETVLKINKLVKNARITGYPDASGKNESANASRSNIKILKDGGHKIDAPSANPSIRDRINSVNALFAHDRLFINTDTCPNLAFALEAQGYDEKGKPEKSDNHPADDDYNDALGYFVHRRYPVERAKAMVTRRAKVL